MKKLLLILIAIMLFASCTDLGIAHRRVKESTEVKIDAVPAVILNSYSQKYPGITTEQWFKVNSNMYAARFELNGKKTYAFFSNAGLFIDDDDIDQYDYDEYDDFLDGWDYFDYDTKE
jgi:hypothetical protein